MNVHVKFWRSGHGLRQEHVDIEVWKWIDELPRAGDFVVPHEPLRVLIETAYPGKYGVSGQLCVVNRVIHTWDEHGTNKVEVILSDLK